MDFSKPIHVENLPDSPFPVDEHSVSSFEEALAVIKAQLGGAPKSLHETFGNEPITFDTRVRGKRRGWVHVSRKPDGWLVNYGNAREKGHTIFVRDAFPSSASVSIPAAVQPDTGKAEQAAERAERAAQKAAEVWDKARPAEADHPYLKRKQVRPTETLRELPVGQLREIIGYPPSASGEPLEGRILIAPVTIGGKVSTVEFIDEHGRKSALAGGRKSGGYWATGPLPDTGRVVIAEGVATALSIAEALGETVVAALSVGNLEKVGRALQRPGRELVIAADLGADGKAHQEAVKAASALGAPLCTPDSELGKGGDFNDLHVRNGLDAIRKVFANPGAPEIIPEISDTTARLPYPVDALPETIREAVIDVRDFTQAPTALVAASALTAVSIAVQGLANVQTHSWLTRPASLFLLTVASSGERKTTCDWFFTKPLKEFVREKEEELAPALQAYNAQMAAWEARKTGLIEEIKKQERAKQKAAVQELTEELHALCAEMPEKPPTPQLLYSDVTTEALAHSLVYSWPTAGLVSSEAGMVLGGHSMSADTIMRNLALLNELWDGADFPVNRRTKESFSVRNVRLTVGLQVQPEVLYSFMDKNGALSRGQGFLARFLFAYPESTQGTRIFKSSPGATPGLEAFQQRLRDLLRQPLPLKDKGDKVGGKMELDLPAITLTPGAFKAWVRYYNRTERRLKEDLRGLTDVGSKAAEQVARLAAVFQIFERDIADIEAQYVEAAAEIVDWHLLEARRFFSEIGGAIDLSDAARLERWLQKYCRDKNTDHITCREARKLGPVRDSKRFEAATQDLAQRDIAWVQDDGKRRILSVNPAFLRQQPSAALAALAALPVSDGKQNTSGETSNAALLRQFAALATPETDGQPDAAPSAASAASSAANGETAQVTHSQQLQPSAASAASAARGESENSLSPTPTPALNGDSPDTGMGTECRTDGETTATATEPSLPGDNPTDSLRQCEICGGPLVLDAGDRWTCPACGI